MNAKCIATAMLTGVIFGCSSAPQQGAEQPERGEVKVTLSQVPPAVQRTIKSELIGGELEDIARKQQQDRTVYETDIVKKGQKWEVIVGEDGSIISKAQEGDGDERKADERDGAGQGGWRDTFAVNKSDLAATGKNPWLTIEPGRVLKLRHGADSLTISILPDAATIDGVSVGVLEERETKDGKLIEVSRNFFATDRSTGDVYYFGEDVDNYKNGVVINHESAWRAGQNGAKFGLFIPGTPRVGEKYYQEIAPKVAMDRVEVVSTDETLTTPAGTFHCLHLKETTPLEADVSHKWYAPGIGMVKDDEFELAERP